MLQVSMMSLTSKAMNSTRQSFLQTAERFEACASGLESAALPDSAALRIAK